MIFRASWASSGLRTKDIAIMSAPVASAQRRSASSFSVRAGVLTLTPGRLMPLWLEILPPTMVLVRHPVVGHADDLGLDVAVVDEDAVADPHVVGQALIGGRPELPVARNVLGGDAELVARGQPERPVREVTKADLRPLQVGQNADRPAGYVAPGPDPLVRRQMIGLAAVAHVEPGDVHASADQRGDLLLA